MLNFRKILVGIDVINGALPAATRQAFRHAIQVASSTGAEVLLLTVADAPPEDSASALPLGDDPSGTVSTLAKVQQELVREAAEWGVRATARVVTGKSWYEIIRTVIHDNIELVVVGTRGTGTMERILFGSTSMKLLRKCPCPVWVTRPAVEGQIPTVLATDDFSETGERVLQVAVGMAQVLQGRLLAMNSVVYRHEGAMRRAGMTDEEDRVWRQSVRDEAERTLTGRLSHLDHRTVPGGSRIKIAVGVPDLTIEETVREEQVTLVVMGTQGRMGLPGILIGNTAERLLPLLTCSVLAIKPAGFVSPVPG